MIPESRVDALYGKTYAECHNLAKRHYEKESVIATATHALFIEYNKSVKDKVDAYIQLAKKGAEVHPKDRQLAYNIYCDLFAGLIEKEPMVKTALEEWVIKVGTVDFNEVVRQVKDYMFRNGYQYEMILDHDIISRNKPEEDPTKWEVPDKFVISKHDIPKISQSEDGRCVYDGEADGVRIHITFTKTLEKDVAKLVSISINGSTEYYNYMSIDNILAETISKYVTAPKENKK